MAQQDGNADRSDAEQNSLKEQYDGMCDLATIFGTITYEGVLYTEEEAREKVPRDVRNGDKTRPIPPAETARAYADYTSRQTQRVACVPSTESMIEAQCAPFSGVVYYHKSVVRGKEIEKDEIGLPEFEFDGYARMQGYRAVMDSDHYEVRLEDADYETGDLTITVSEVEGQ